MKNFFYTLKSALLLLLVAALVFGGGIWCGTILADQPVSVEPQATELPGVTETRTVTRQEVEVALAQAADLTTYTGTYTVEVTTENAKRLLGLKVPFSTNAISLTCDGVVKVGFDIREVQVAVDNDARVIYLDLPETRVLDNYVIWDSVVCAEHHAFFNRIEFDQYQTLISEVEQLGLDQVKAAGIFRDAQASARSTLQGFLSGFADYQVVVR